mmetsp:Transcript_46694/g.89176  ORF Transcript_46694/g.89176 Transcript_46694/m.89176 type:complete len:262 (+) Transcript_46694:2427-3212(+)
MHDLAALADPKVVVGAVGEHLWAVEHFRHQLLDIRHVLQHAPPGGGHVRKHAIRVVESAALQSHRQRGVGQSPDEVVEHGACAGVVRPVVELGNDWVIKGPVAFHNLLQPLWVERSYGLGQVSERGGRGQVQGVGGVVGQDPREHWVLRDVVVGAPGDCVQLHEVLEVGYLAIHPALGQAGPQEKLVRRMGSSHVDRVQVGGVSCHQGAAGSGAFLCRLEVEEAVGSVGEEELHSTLDKQVLADVHLCQFWEGPAELVLGS